MKIDYLRQSIKDIKFDIDRINKHILDCEDSILMSDRDANKRKQQLDNDIRALSEKDKIEKEKQISLPFQNRIKELEEEKSERTKEYEKDLSSLSTDSYKEKFNKEITSKEDIEKKYTEVISLSENVTSKRLINDYMSFINIDEKCSSVEDFDKEYSALVSLVDKLGVGSRFDVHTIVDKIFIKINPETFEKDQRKLIAYIVIYILILFIFRKYLFYTLIVVFSLFAVLNIYKSYNIIKCLRFCKYSKDNIDNLEEYTKNGMEDCMSHDREMITEGYNLDIKDIEKDIDSEQKKMREVLEEFYSNYKFDSSHLVEQYNSAMSSKSREEDMLRSRINDDRNKINELNDKLNNLNSQLEEANKEVLSVYLDTSKCGLDYKFNNEFLIDKIDDKPIFFEHPKESCIFIYKDYYLCKNLIYLMHLQNFNRTLPNNIEEYIFDTERLCGDFQIFLDKDIKSETLCSVKEDIESSIEDLHSTLVQRNGNINREFKSIEDYNSFMTSIESTPETYIMVYSIGLYDNLFSKDEFNQILNNGGKLGMYVNLFCTQKEIRDMCNSKPEFLSSISNYYVINSTNIRRLTLQEVKELRGVK